VAIDLDEYCESVKDLPGMKDWIMHFRSWRSSAPYGVDFEFEDAQSTLFISPEHKTLIAMGPVLKLQWPEQNRICVLFVPPGKAITAFFPLMPPPGTFSKPGNDFLEQLKREGLRDEQISECAEALTRCGAFRAKIAHPSQINKSLEFWITYQGPGNNRLVLTKFASGR